MENRKIRFLVFIIILGTTILGQVYFKPFNTDFRVSIGIIALTVLLLRFDKVPVVLTCGLTGVSIFLFRFGLDYLSSDFLVLDLVFKHIPSAFFYFFYGLFLVTFNFRGNVSKPVVCAIVIALSDVGANTIELIVRGDLGSVNPEMASIGIVVTGIIRALFGYILYMSEKFYSVLIASKEQREKYKEFVMMRANLKSEIFFMQKSMEDIEESMKESFSIYKALNNTTDGLSHEEVSSLKNRMLGISKGIHEIKKDYSRIIAGVGSVIPDMGYTILKDSEEILSILEEVTIKYITRTGKQIEFRIESNEYFPVFYYSPLLSVLNNLIVNAVDAIDDKGWIKVDIILNEETIEMHVTDNGGGIKEKNLKTIFTPGFSTKFDKRTGKMSTGIGLTHVKQIVEKSLDGSITVDSVYKKYTQFKVIVSKDIICTGGDDEQRENFNY